MKSARIHTALFSAVFLLLMLFFPAVCRTGAADGLVLCGRVVIPALFPFTVCALLLMRAGAADAFRRIFKRQGARLAVFFLSMLGGYPVGARLVKELYDAGELDRGDARRLLCCCVNAGPAFVVIAVGDGIFASKKAGYLLLAAHLLSACVLAAITFPFLKASPPTKKPAADHSASFVTAVSDAAGSMITVSAFVIFFSALNAYLIYAAQRFPALFSVTELTEVTAGVASCGNLYTAAFLLGFAGLSVWFQAAAVTGDIGLGLPRFALARLAHGGLSALFTRIFTKIFGTALETLGNSRSFSGVPAASTAAVSVSLFILLILLILTLSGKNRGRKIREDLI